MRNKWIARGSAVLVEVRGIGDEPPTMWLPGIVEGSFIAMNGKRYYEVRLDDGTYMAPVRRLEIRVVEQEVLKALIS